MNKGLKYSNKPVRGFELLRPEAILPRRQTKGSAGYDLALPEAVTLAPGAVVIARLGVKAYFPADEVLLIFVRSSLAYKKHLRLANSVAVIDSDYYNNPDNEGEIMLALHNFGAQPVTLAAQERIAQAIFVQFFKTAEETAPAERLGGIGHTGTV